MWKYPKVPETWDKLEYPQDKFDLYTGVEREDFYKVLLWLDWKIIRVSPELLADLRKFNSKKWSKKHPNREYDVKLEKYKKNPKYKWRSNSQIKDIDTKYLRELWWFAEKGDIIEDAVVVISQKEQTRILAIAYKINKNGIVKIRCYVRYSTLIEKRQKAQRVIAVISERFWNVLDWITMK